MRTLNKRTLLSSSGLILVGAGAYFCGFANQYFTLPPAALLAQTCLFLLSLQAKNAKNAFLNVWLMASAGFTANLYWLVYPLHEVGGLSLPPAFACVILLAAYLAVYPALCSLGVYWFQQIIPRSPSSTGKQIFRFSLLCIHSGILYAGCEVVCGKLFTGFPWLNLATAFAPWPEWVQGVSLIGSYGLSGIFSCLSFLIANLFIARKPEQCFSIVFSSIFILAIFAFGRYKFTYPVSSQAPQLNVACIQGNIEQNQKWSPNTVKKTLDHYLKLSQLALEKQNHAPDKSKVDFVLWPETAMPFPLAQEMTYTPMIQHFAKQNEVYLGIGTLAFKNISEDASAHSTRFNAAQSYQPVNRFQLIAPDGSILGHYDKEHLVPFGEYLPFFFHFSFLEKIIQGINFLPGKNQNLPVLTINIKETTVPTSEIQPGSTFYDNDKQNFQVALGVLICYEIIFPDLARARVKQGANVLITISNDAWFNLSSAPWQHLYLASMRAIEEDRPLIRCTNTGISAYVDHLGRITTFGNLFQDAYSVLTVQGRSSPTCYFHISAHLELFLAFYAVTVLSALAFTHLFFRKKHARLN